MIKNKKKLLIRIGSILACVLLVAGLALPCFAVFDNQTVLDQQALLAQLYGNYDVDAFNFLQSSNKNYNDIAYFSVINDETVTINYENYLPYFFVSLNDAQNINLSFPYLAENSAYVSLTVYETGTLNVVDSITFAPYLGMLLCKGYTESGSADAVDYYCEFELSYFAPSGDVLAVINIRSHFNASVGSVGMTGDIVFTNAKIYNSTSGELVDYDLLVYDLRGFFLQCVGTNDILPYLVGEVYTPSADLALNFPQSGGGGATDEELQEAYDNGFTAGQTEGYNNGYSVGYGNGESAGFSNSMFRDFWGTVTEAMNNTKLFKFNDIQGNEQWVTLGLVLSAGIGIALFIWILKMFAGG